jgi:hypothetical protein
MASSSRGSVSRGRPFSKGNPGRPAGSRNRASVVVAALGEDKLIALRQKGEEVALAGDPVMLKFFLGRLLSRERLVKFNLPPIVYADDVVAVLRAILRGISEGIITPGEGAAMAVVANSAERAIDTADLVKRLDMLEAKFNAEVIK